MAEEKSPKNSKVLDLGKVDEIKDEELDDIAAAGCEGMSGISQVSGSTSCGKRGGGTPM